VLRQLHLLTFILFASFSSVLSADNWRTETISPIAEKNMQEQWDSIDELISRHFGRKLNGNKLNDIPVMQRLLDENIVRAKDVRLLQAMGVILGRLLRSENGLNWVVYIDRYGRSRALQVPGFDKEFIFPVTQISRKAEVGIKVDILEVYGDLEKSILDIRNKPPF
jgi:hypothetical protein